MSNQDTLNLYIRQLHQRLRLGVSLRGVAIITATALVTTILLVLILNRFAFPVHGLAGARSLLLIALACAAALALALPLRRLTRRRATEVAESAHPEFQQRLVTFDDRENKGNDPFLELLAADTLSVAHDAQPAKLLPNNKLYFLAGAGIACVAVLVWLVAAGPGYLGYGASLLWTGPKAAPLYDIHVTPGNAAVRRNADQLITAQIIGLKPEKVRLFAHYKSSAKTDWEPVAMQPMDRSNFQFLFAGLPEDVEYYVEAGPLKSQHYKVRVVDLPSVKQMKVTYHYPKWTGMKPVSDDHGGDLRALEGTTAELSVQMDRPLHNGRLTLDDGKEITLTGGEGNVYKGSILMQKDGAYHVAAVDQGQPVRLSEDYFIATDKANPPEIAIDRPVGDYRASPIEEVTVGVKASDDFGLNNVALHYSVNGGEEKTIDIPQKPGAKDVSGSTTLSLEDFKLVPGDLVTIYATAKDGHSEARTDMSFIQADPFEREFSQSQQMGGGGGGGSMGAGDQTDISKREKELIAATWKRQNEKSASAKDVADAGKFLSSVQTKLQDQALSLAARMESRDLSSANDDFNSFGHDMQAAAAAMTPSAEKLKQTQWREAIPAEQKALQYLLRAEATFRKIEVAFRHGGGGGGGGGGAGRDLASLFDLELDTEKNQYETAQTGSAADQRAKAIDDALQKLDALARRQEELAKQQHNTPQTMQQRWEQEMLRREAEQLQRQMEQMAQNNQQNGQQSGEGQQQSQQGQQGRQGQQSQQGQNGQQSGSGSSGSSGQSQSAQSRGSQGSSGASGGVDPRVTQALNRLRSADEAMKRSAGQQSNEAARQAADQLREAAGLMGSAQQQQATGRLDSMARESDRLSKEEHAQADRIKNLANQPGPSNQEQYSARVQQRNKLADDRQQLSDDLSQLEKNMRNAAREMAPEQPQAASKLRDALGGMDQSDLTNRTQRTADWLRRGINPNSNGTEEGISKGLEQLSQQVHEAQQGVGPGKPGQGQQQGGEQEAALDHLERFRSQIESLAGRGQNSLSRQPGGQPGQQGQRGQQQAQGGQQPGQGQQAGQAGQQGGQAGQQQGQSGQPGQSGQMARGSQGNWSSQGGPGAHIGGGGNQVAQDNLSGDVGNWRSGGGAVGTAWNNINTGNNRFAPGRGVAPDNSPVPADPERTFQQSMAELGQLHHLAQNDPEALKEVQELAKEMQKLDPRRFPGNPAMVEQLHTEVLSGVDRLELQLAHDDQGKGQVRTPKAATVPPGYEEAVADYYRRLSKSQ
ncbi:MAG TPA: hypothetical protein VMB49_19345 [Acidobacteriaceae bacterium]|nr:hypothetical protein [Acidobacteriaceae bacterium]